MFQWGHGYESRKKYVINKNEVGAHSTPRHIGTVNCCLSGKSASPPQNLEVVIGELKKGDEARYHYHKKSEQVIFVLERACDEEFHDGTREKTAADDLIHFPINMGHRIVVSSDEFRAVVIYSPRPADDDMIPID